MAGKKNFIIGIDTGGTFTDVVVLGEAGEVWTAKASTTPDDFSRGVMDAVKEAAGAVGIETAALLGQNERGGRLMQSRHDLFFEEVERIDHSFVGEIADVEHAH